MTLPIVDREREQQELRSLTSRERPTLALLTGRRRVGKTYLLANTWDAETLFLYTASRTTPETNRQQLLQDLAAWRASTLAGEVPAEPIDLGDFPTWRTIFRLLTRIAAERSERAAGQPTVVVLDEFQYLADGPAGVADLASELNAVWESRELRASGGATIPLLLVLAGSAVSTMEALAAGGSPLYGRFDWQHTLTPFGYHDAAELAAFSGDRDRALAYGIFGGTPRYLAAIDTSRTLEANVCGLLLSPRGEVRLLVETALDQEEGLRDVAKYRAVLRAVADGCTERNTIAQRAGLPNDNGLRDKLATLIELGYLETRRNIDAKPNSTVRYELADAAFRFYYRFVAANQSMLERYPAEQVWAARVAPFLDGYMGLEFERMAREAYDRIAPARGFPLVQRWGRWEGVDRERQSLEIDLIAELADKRWMTGAVKWDRAPVAAAVHHDHLAMLRRAAEAGRAWAHNALEESSPLFYVAAGGFSDGFVDAVSNSEREVILWDLPALYR
jgi:AAA+ ATPase superfamily predicted ATPase